MAVVQFALEMKNAIEDIANTQEDLVALIRFFALSLSYFL